MLLEKFQPAFDSFIRFIFEYHDAKLTKDIDFIPGDVAYSVDIYSKINKLDLQTPGTDINMIHAKYAANILINKIESYKRSLYNRRAFCQILQ